MAHPTRVGTAALAFSLVLAGCAQGTGSSGEAPEFSSDAPLEGELSIMGFGTGDEIGQVRYDRAVAGLGDVEVSLSEGALDIQAFLSAVASGNPPDLVYASRDLIGTFASRDAILSLDECVEALQRAAGAQPRIGESVHELQQLDGELDVAQASRTELDLVRRILGIDVLHDPLAHALDAVDEVLPRSARPDLRLHGLEVLGAQLGVSCHRTRLQQCLELPALRPTVVIRQM